MSNASVGNIYHQIINEVIEASRVDFEDQGVGEEVLEELRKVCSFFLCLCLPLRTSHTQAHEYKPSGCCYRFDPICTCKSTAFSFISPERSCNLRIEVGAGFCVFVRVLSPSLARRCWLAMLAAWALCWQRRCRQWPVARIAGQRAKKGRAAGSQV